MFRWHANSSKERSHQPTKDQGQQHPILEIALVQHLVCSLVHTFWSLNHRPPERSGPVQNRSDLGGPRSSDRTTATLILRSREKHNKDCLAIEPVLVFS
jgi:hypothetical protein